MQNFEKHIKNFYNSDDFKSKAQNAVPFFKGVKDYVFGRPTTLENAVSPSWYNPTTKFLISCAFCIVECKFS